MKKQIILDGDSINNISDFHNEIAVLLDFPEFYGKNLDALWDCLTGFIDPDFTLVWKNHTKSRDVLGDKFDKIIELLEDLKNEEDEFNFELQ